MGQKIRGKFHYLGSWSDPDAALTLYRKQADNLHAGRTPRENADGVTVADTCNRFLTSKKHLLGSGEIVELTFRDYYSVCKRIVDAFGKDRLASDLRPDDCERLQVSLSKTNGPVTLGNLITRIRVVFKYAYDTKLLESPVRYGKAFDKPSRKVIRKAKAGNGKRLFEADELRTILDAADPVIRAMVLLGVNCGFGNHDAAAVPQTAVNFETCWIDFPRPKNGIDRRVPLWAETVKALRNAIERRPKPKDDADAGLCFLTSRGNRWVCPVAVKETGRSSWRDAVGEKFCILLKNLNLWRPGLNFYALRHTFETIGGESRDQVAVNAIMGHADSTMAGVYRERISDERLKAVTDTVHRWLFPPEEEATK